ncbi:protein DEFECTIVE IN MERISTEM SILENCING 3 isoform X1 [Arachis hypogaea]|uniref:protein DEFECTIVE IN MERISTEM SILENCING 3 isoform X1 n=1 Tax=Arachis hypogaea TaxID=3818 RepID=UPI000DEC79C5
MYVDEAVTFLVLNQNDANHESIKNEIKKHEDNLKFLNSQSNRLAESILDLQVSLGRYHSCSVITPDNGSGPSNTEDDTTPSITEDDTTEQILKKENSAAGIFCWLKANAQTSNLALEKDAVGVVATLARVESDELSRILSEYLGLETMLAIVCSTNEGVNALEKYNPEGTINCNAGLHGIGSSIKKNVNGRFAVICLESFRPYVGGFVANDPQKKLAIPKPRFPNEECPAGFFDYAVNMLYLESNNLSFVTSSGHGLRETLFYGLFSGLQVYRTRNEMMSALPCIDEGAVSLDGGMIKKNGMFVLGSRKDVEVKFGIFSGRSGVVPPNYSQAEEVVRRLKWESTKLAEDIQREQQLLDHLKAKSANKVA